MSKIIAAMNMTLDGFCDHTSMNADEEIHQHYNDLLRNAGTLVYGRTTYQLMEDYWPGLVKNPSGNKPMDDFAVLIDNISKIVFSTTLKEVSWKNSVLKNKINREEMLSLKQTGNGLNKDILVGSPGMIATFTNLHLIDEYQISVHPVIVGKGLILFKNIQERVELKLIKTKTFACGAVTFYYETLSEP
ncbi:MAG: dihydrofolate reductase family protein [Chitinophagaceae bacterium]